VKKMMLMPMPLPQGKRRKNGVLRARFLCVQRVGSSFALEQQQQQQQCDDQNCNT
jgi:hypothetical protein